MSGIRFSIVVTSYNQSAFIKAAVDSALAQPHAAKEVIVVDDCSTDGSRELLEAYGDAIHFVKFAANRGAIEARNQGAARAQGDYLVFLDGDDILMPWALDVYDRIVTDRKPKIIFAPHIWFQDEVPPITLEGNPGRIKFVEYPTFLAKDRSVGLSASTFVIQRQSFQDVGGWSPGIFHLDCQDLCTKLGIVGRMILIASPPTAYYRIHTANSIHAVRPFLQMAHQLMAKERAGEYPGGPEHRFERYAWLGGVWFFWTKRAFRESMYGDGLKLAADGWPMILATIFRRSGAWLRRRRPVETLEFDPQTVAVLPSTFVKA